MATENVYSPDYNNNGNPKPSIPELKDAIENARLDAEALAHQPSGNVVLEDGTNTGHPSALALRDEAQNFKNDAQTAKSDAVDAKNKVTNLVEKEAISGNPIWQVETTTEVFFQQQENGDIYVLGTPLEDIIVRDKAEHESSKSASDGNTYAWLFESKDGNKLFGQTIEGNLYVNDSEEVKTSSTDNIKGSTVIYEDKDRYNAFPKATRTLDGNFLVVFGDLTGHTGTGKLRLIKYDLRGNQLASSIIDEGDDWYTGPGECVILPNGDILVAHDVRDRSTSPETRYPPKIQKSTDDGSTFSLLTQLPGSATGKEGLPEDLVYDRENDNLWIAITGPNGFQIWKSTDRGSTWNEIQNGVDINGENEAGLVILDRTGGSETLMLLARTGSSSGLSQIYSTDGGNTWENGGYVENTTGIPTRPSVVERGGTITVIFGDRSAGRYYRLSGSRSELKNDPSNTSLWSVYEPLSVPWRDSLNDNDTGYADVVKTPHSELFIDYDDARDDNTPDIYAQQITL